mgnify:CR=1 FL=1
MIMVYEINWLGVRSFVSAPSRGKAKAWAMRMADNAGMWSSGKPLSGLRCKVADYVPPDVAVAYYEARK